jgi:N-methylhydantoinase A
MSEKWYVGVDIGGTFTDIALIGSAGNIITKKISSSVGDYAQSIIDGVSQLIEAHGFHPHDIVEIRHATTVGSNTILEHKGALTGLITTKGFRDILEIRTLRMPRLYDIAWVKPEPLVERRLRRVVDERMGPDGRVIRELNVCEAEAVIASLIADGVESIAICLMHSYVNPKHEQMIADILRRKWPHLPISVSSEILPEIKEYERTSTTVIDAYVKPVVSTYLALLRQYLQSSGIECPVYLMQSNGGLMSAEAAVSRPMAIIESGPAAGVVGAQALSRLRHLGDLITFDMGGTTAKASTVENGIVTRASEYSVGGGIMVGSRLLTGAGYLLKVPSVDLAEVGAGGGSIVMIDAGGSIQVGPQSAGAYPGPVCYDKGGTFPTITDANVILGYLNPDHLVGGAVRLNAEKARQIFLEKVANPLGLGLASAAHGVIQIAASNMMRAVRAVSSERGRDPRDFSLFAFGGNGPLFACVMADILGIDKVIVPQYAGLFSAFGLLYADVEHHYSRSFRRLVTTLDPESLICELNRMDSVARATLMYEGYSGDEIQIQRSAALHYQGQSSELNINISEDMFRAETLNNLAEAFATEHENVYGHRADSTEPVELVSIQVVAKLIGSEQRIRPRMALHRDESLASRTRSAYFGSKLGWLDATVVNRSELSVAMQGPIIVEEYDCTCVVPPGWSAELDESYNIRIVRV